VTRKWECDLEWRIGILVREVNQLRAVYSLSSAGLFGASVSAGNFEVPRKYGVRIESAKLGEGIENPIAMGGAKQSSFDHAVIEKLYMNPSRSSFVYVRSEQFAPKRSNVYRAANIICHRPGEIAAR
jgi:hypothetical protein